MAGGCFARCRLLRTLSPPGDSMTPRHTVVAASSLNELEKLVHRTLCEQDRLDPQQAPMHSTLVRRGQHIVGLYFTVQGPRLLRSHAIWACDEHRVLCYDSAGLRFLELRLCEAPDAAALAA
jgi:hypothetical protein